MSVEASVLALLVEDGSPKKAYQQGISRDDFEVYEEEFQWIENRAANNKPINPRIFREKFTDFEWVVPNEKLGDLLEELKQERAFVSLRAAIETVDEQLEPENAVQKAEELRDVLTEILRLHSPVSDVLLKKDWQKHLDRVKQLRVLKDQGEIAGIPTGFKWIDNMWGGLINGRVVTVLGRSGEMKSFFIAKMMCEAWKSGYRVGLFSPEMNEHEHWCRCHTILSADSLIQEQCGIKKAFRNRALMEGHGFNIKSYKRFMEYLEKLRGEIVLFTQKNRRQKMTPQFIDARIDDLGLDLVIVDPIYKLKSPRKRDSKVWELADLIDDIEDIAKGHNIPVVISNQAHRQVGANAMRRAPTKDNSYMSDALIHESDHVVGVKYDAEDHLLRLRCSKSRFGGEFDIDVKCHPNIGIMRELSEPKENWFNGSEPNFSEESEEDVPQMQEGH